MREVLEVTISNKNTIKCHLGALITIRQGYSAFSRKVSHFIICLDGKDWDFKYTYPSAMSMAEKYAFDDDLIVEKANGELERLWKLPEDIQNEIRGIATWGK